MSELPIHFPDHHGDVDDEGEEGEPLTWGLDHVELVTVGVDVGSSTSHLILSRLGLARLAQSLSSRFVVVSREILHRSPILLTPFGSDGLIQVAELQRFVDDAYEAAGIGADDVDSGAVILTGHALERRNSRVVAELFEEYCGRFVCATAGHNLEAILAAHGSGAVSLSQTRSEPLLHVDAGGGTTKLAIAHGGSVIATAALAVGARMEHPEGPAGMARAVLEAVRGSEELPLLLTPPLAAITPGAVTFSGGVAEYVYGRERRRFDDAGPEFAAELRRVFTASGWRILPCGEGIRATVIGASQFTVQLSGNTIHLTSPELLPLRNVPVADARNGSIARSLARLDRIDGEGPLALALTWKGEPRYATVRELAGRIAEALPRTLAEGAPLVLAVDADLGRSLGQVLVEEFAPHARVVALDGLDLRELDYLDVGEMLRPAGVVPVVVKSLAFPG
ncbi:MAG TPA: ethanolamine ammonia-lyase reactivating factor EutA [Candidatus Dormibacteraeota bacterium]|nr:ethanolamine ammonia-lyase reactivating factor EutA [Candidatus Dormibacteraeota bacterium]